MNSKIKLEDAKIALRDFTLNVGNWRDVEGLQIVSGANGSGKSTFLRSILGLFPLFQGHRVVLDPKISFGYVPQNYRQSLIPWTSCIGNLQKFKGVDVTAGVEMLEELGVPSTDIQKRPRLLSGGQCQRLAIVRELLISPSVLILDEPFSSLDVGSIDKVANYIASNIENGTRVIMTSHQSIPPPLKSKVANKIKIDRLSDIEAKVYLCD